MATSLLDKVIEQYLGSHDFNGYPFRMEDEGRRKEVTELVRAGLIEVISDEDYPNPHIRPWPCRRPREQQIQDIVKLDVDNHTLTLCLYPTVAALQDRLDPQLYAGQPYSRRLAEGHGALQLVYFRFDVLEMYRNDPRFSFDFHDFGAEASISSEAFEDEGEPEEDKISISHIGFAYNRSAYDPEDAATP